MKYIMTKIYDSLGHTYLPPFQQKMTVFSFFAGGPDALNDLKFISGVESLSIYHMPKNQISETKTILIFFS